MLWNSGNRAQPLRPERALTTASWVAALILLALNDHYLKQAGLLPGWLTGKLSDFAGLYVAPALLATLLRVRTRSALGLCHAAVGAVFAASNLDPTCASLLASAMRPLGFDWLIVTDAEDLIALPVLLASQHWLGAAMARMEPPRVRAGVVRSARFGLAGVGLLLCMATSDDDTWSSSIETGGPHLHNTSTETLLVLVQPLRPSVLIDCNAIAEAPAERIPDSAFAPAVAFRLRPRENLGLEANTWRRAGFEWDGGVRGGSSSTPCNAVRVSGSDLTPMIVFWRSSDNFERFVPRTYGSTSEYADGAVVIEFKNGKHRGYKSIGGDFTYAIRRTQREVPLGCGLPDEGKRPAVSEELSSAVAVVQSADQGPDGCVALRFTSYRPLPRPSVPGAGQGGSNVPSGLGGGGNHAQDMDAGVDDEHDGGAADPLPPVIMPRAPVYVCVPPGMFPFAAGDELDIVFGTDGARTFTRRDARNLPELELILAQVRDTAFLAGLDIRVRPRVNCPYIRTESCAQTAVAAEVTVMNGSEKLTLAAGEGPLHLVRNGTSVDLALPFGQRRVLLDTTCANGAKVLGADVELVVVVDWGGR